MQNNQLPNKTPVDLKDNSNSFRRIYAFIGGESDYDLDAMTIVRDCGSDRTGRISRIKVTQTRIRDHNVGCNRERRLCGPCFAQQPSRAQITPVGWPTIPKAVVKCQMFKRN